MKRKPSFFSLFILLVLSVNVQAEVIKRIYEVSLPVVSQEKQIRTTAFEQGLIEVSVRVSGNSLAPTHIDLKQAARMVRQYHYKAMSQPDIDAYMIKTSSLIAPKFKLWMQFDDARVKQLLRSNGLPLWGYQRPNVLVWLAVKDGRNRYLLKKSDASQIKDAVTLEAKRRGLPLIWPKYDAQDKKVVSFIDVWGEFMEPVKQASKRYPVDAVIVGRMDWSKGRWTANWSLLMDNKAESWKLSAVDLGILMNSGVGVATDQISRRFAVYADSANDGELVLRVSDLNNLGQYSKASHYLASLAPVKNVYALQVNQYQVDFHIELSGDESDLKRIIALGKTLQPDTRPLEIQPPEVNLEITPEINPENKPQADTNGNFPVDVNQPVSGQKPGMLPGSSPRQNISKVLRYRLNG